MTADQVDGIFALLILVGGAALLWYLGSVVANVHGALGWQSRRLWCVPLTIGLILIPGAFVGWLVCVMITRHQIKKQERLDSGPSSA